MGGKCCFDSKIGAAYLQETYIRVLPPQAITGSVGCLLILKDWNLK